MVSRNGSWRPAGQPDQRHEQRRAQTSHKTLVAWLRANASMFDSKPNLTRRTTVVFAKALSRQLFAVQAVEFGNLHQIKEIFKSTRTKRMQTISPRILQLSFGQSSPIAATRRKELAGSSPRRQPRRLRLNHQNETANMSSNDPVDNLRVGAELPTELSRKPTSEASRGTARVVGTASMEWVPCHAPATGPRRALLRGCCCDEQRKGDVRASEHNSNGMPTKIFRSKVLKPKNLKIGVVATEQRFSTLTKNELASIGSNVCLSTVCDTSRGVLPASITISRLAPSSAVSYAKPVPEIRPKIHHFLHLHLRRPNDQPPHLRPKPPDTYDDTWTIEEPGKGGSVWSDGLGARTTRVGSRAQIGRNHPGVRQLRKPGEAAGGSARTEDLHPRGWRNSPNQIRPKLIEFEFQVAFPSCGRYRTGWQNHYSNFSILQLFLSHPHYTSSGTSVTHHVSDNEYSRTNNHVAAHTPDPFLGLPSDLQNFQTMRRLCVRAPGCIPDRAVRHQGPPSGTTLTPLGRPLRTTYRRQRRLRRAFTHPPPRTYEARYFLPIAKHADATITFPKVPKPVAKPQHADYMAGEMVLFGAAASQSSLKVAQSLVEPFRICKLDTRQVWVSEVQSDSRARARH
ncbi:hypothetical protein K456DRAFT_43343 [Colletotrichum gloeosporioides 23]|nr:hypothetical protein K456DRAFT_43343 [Colletotrichum gloeosporioides 23]